MNNQWIEYNLPHANVWLIGHSPKYYAQGGRESILKPNVHCCCLFVASSGVISLINSGNTRFVAIYHLILWLELVSHILLHWIYIQATVFVIDLLSFVGFIHLLCDTEMFNVLLYITKIIKYCIIQHIYLWVYLSTLLFFQGLFEWI